MSTSRETALEEALRMYHDAAMRRMTVAEPPDWIALTAVSGSLLEWPDRPDESAAGLPDITPEDRTAWNVLGLGDPSDAVQEIDDAYNLGVKAGLLAALPDVGRLAAAMHQQRGPSHWVRVRKRGKLDTCPAQAAAIVRAYSALEGKS